MDETPKGIGILNDDVLVTIFGFLPLVDRHRALPRVCRRWQRLAHSPRLLHTLDLVIDDSEDNTPTRAYALCRWLAGRAAGRVRQLRLRLTPPAGASPADGAAMLAALGASLAACGHAGGLSELRLELQQLTSSRSSSSSIGGKSGSDRNSSGGGDSWVAACSGSLRRLALIAAGPLSIGPAGSTAAAAAVTASSLHALTTLAALELSGQPLLLEAAGALPPELTCLRMSGHNSPSLPWQLAALGRLQCLSLHRATCDASAYSLLAALSSLRQLHLSSCSQLPACLPAAAPLLRGLHLDNTPLEVGYMREAAASAELQAGLAPLTQLLHLTHLVLSYDVCLTGLPPALAGLSRLQRFAWDGPAPRNPGLPAGPWLPSLRALLLPADVAAGSLRQGLAEAAGNLTCLGLHPYFPAAPRTYQAILRWSAHHPTLQRLSLGLHGPHSYSQTLPKLELTAALFDAALEAQRGCPRLCIDRCSGAFTQLAQLGPAE